MSDEKVLKKISQLEKKLDKFADKVDEKFDQVDEKFDQVDAKFCQVDAKFDRVDARFDRIDDKLLEHDLDIKWLKENVATKEDFQGVMEILEVILKTMTRNDQEVTMLSHRVEEHDNDIIRLKAKVGLAA
ncbi:MAG: hypothetical protein ABII07_03050 [Patescibacteria group bacterium]|nr:hypothetical protein [Patescibacteria group bacterium]